jgi:hypothetical protein
MLIDALLIFVVVVHGDCNFYIKIYFGEWFVFVVNKHLIKTKKFFNFFFLEEQ